MVKKFKLLFNTVKYLKRTQVLHQLKYRIKKAGTLATYNKLYSAKDIAYLSFKKLPPVYDSYLGNDEFEFLNLKVKFKSDIDWNFLEHGKLWNYNLQYCNYLLQDGLSLDKKKELILSLYDWLDKGKLALEPYPASLRINNIIRLCSLERIKEDSILSFIHAELDFLSKRPEYHILGNHLLENAFALVMGGAFFSNNIWFKQGKNILNEQLNEQILSDGAHFELSPMYHQIIFFRLLELIDWYSVFKNREQYFEKSLIYKAEEMSSWLRNITFNNGSIPHFNDSAEGISYSSKWLFEYADDLGIKSSNVPLSSSGYRKVDRGSYECRIDFGQVGPSYQPGHAHADALSFILNLNDKPLFVEKGTSTYQIGEIRNTERSTSAHNTVVVNQENQTNVWSGFRVAKRAEIEITKDLESEIAAFHDGYKKYGIVHKRSFQFQEHSILIQDVLEGNSKVSKEFHLHLSPGLDCRLEGNNVVISQNVYLIFDGAINTRIEDYDMANGYNKYISSKKVVVLFNEILNTQILFKQ